MTTRRLTPKQKKVLEFIRDYSEVRGYAPTQQEIADRFGFRSLGTVQNYLVRLEAQGFLRRSWNAKRAIELIRPEPIGLEVPLLGYVAAGKPIEAVVSEETLEVPPSMIREGETFVLRVSGDSMVGEGILDGDYVVVRRRATAVSGQTVVALVDGGATVKRLYQKGDRIELHPANPAVAPILVRPDQELRIEGILVGVIRHCDRP